MTDIDALATAVDEIATRPFSVRCDGDGAEFDRDGEKVDGEGETVDVDGAEVDGGGEKIGGDGDKVVQDMEAAGFSDAKKLGDQCKELAKLTSKRCSGKVLLPPPSEMIIFQAAVPPGSDWRYLSNLTRREYRVDVSTEELFIAATFTSVESLFQGLKFNLVQEFALGGALEGEAGIALVNVAKPGFIEKYAKKASEGPADGFVALFVSRLWGDALAVARATSPALATLDAHSFHSAK